VKSYESRIIAMKASYDAKHTATVSEHDSKVTAMVSELEATRISYNAQITSLE
jgi:hypothetical protein